MTPEELMRSFTEQVAQQTEESITRVLSREIPNGDLEVVKLLCSRMSDDGWSFALTPPKTEMTEHHMLVCEVSLIWYHHGEPKTQGEWDAAARAIAKQLVERGEIVIL